MISSNHRQEIMIRREAIMVMVNRGLRVVDIAKEMKLSTQAVCHNIKMWRKEHGEEAIQSKRDAAVKERRLKVAKMLQQGMSRPAIVREMGLKRSTFDNDYYAIKRDGVDAFIAKCEGNGLPQVPMFWGLPQDNGRVEA